MTATANDGGNTNSTSGTILVTVAEHADAPTLTVSDTSGTEDQPIALSISSTLVDALGAADPDESLSITITGIPTDATLSNTNGSTLTPSGGSITFTQAQLTAGVLNGLSITPTSADDPNFTLHVTAVSYTHLVPLVRLKRVELDFPFGSYTKSFKVMRALLDKLNAVSSLKVMLILPSAPVCTTSPKKTGSPTFVGSG